MRGFFRARAYPTPAGVSESESQKSPQPQKVDMRLKKQHELDDILSYKPLLRLLNF